MNIVVTGATSFVGGSVVRELLYRGHHVFAVLRVNSAKRDVLLRDREKAGQQAGDKGSSAPGELTILEADLGELLTLADKIDEICDIFLHMGWRGAGSNSRRNGEVQEESVRDALNAVRAAKLLGCKRFLFTGSQAEYGVHDSLMSEEAVCAPTSPYGQAKLSVCRLAGALCEALSLDYGHARIFSTYGPGDHPWSLISSCIRAFEAREEMELSACTQKWNFMYIDDAARAIADLAEYDGRLSDYGSVYNLAGPMEETSELKVFVEKLYELCGKRGGLKYGVHPANAEGIVNLIPDIGKMKRVIGWEPEVLFEQGIRGILCCDGLGIKNGD